MMTSVCSSMSADYQVEYLSRQLLRNHCQRHDISECSRQRNCLYHTILYYTIISCTLVQVEEGMSSGGSTGMPATPAPTPFSIGPSGIKPEDLVAGISRLSVIQEQDTATIVR